jgi:hypothetical protein
MKNLKFIIPSAAFAVFVAGYVGLSLYSSAQAEKQIEDWLYDNKLEGQVQWQSVRASPFGASVTLNEVVVIAEQAPLKGLEVNVEKVRISDFADERDLKSLAVDLQGVSFPVVADDQPSAVATMLFGDLLAQSGRDKLEPFDLALQARYDNEASEASMSFSIRVPDLFAAQGGTQVGNVRNLDSLLGDSAAQLMGLSGMGSRDVLRMLGKQSALLKNATDMQQRMRGIELGDSSFTLQDLGYFKRSNLLKQRYGYVLDPAKGDAAAQRQDAFERDLRKQEKDCVERWSRASEDAEQACTDVLSLLNGQSDGFRVVSEPEERVRLGDLEALLEKPERASRILQRLNQRVETL